MLASARERWWVVAAMIVMLIMAWGSHSMFLYELMYDLLPGYKNFRTVSMALVVVQWAVPLMAVVAICKLWTSELGFKQLAKYVGIAFGVVVAMMIMMAVLADYGLADITERLGNEWWVEQLREVAESARRDNMVADMLRLRQ
jgi:hypothetical protein